MGRSKKTWILMAALWSAAAVPMAAQEPRSAAVTEPERGAARGFDPEQSAALFIGVRHFTHDTSLSEVRYAADDAVDLAYALAEDRAVPLVKPGRVVLALSGEPQKPESREHLVALTKDGAKVYPAGQNDIISQLDAQSGLVGPKGVFIVSLATHAYVADGQLRLLASGSLLRHHETSLTTTTLFDIVSNSVAPRSLIFIDACRERLSSDTRGAPDTVPFLKAMSAATGQVVFYGAAPGRYAYDDDSRRNGVFTAALLDGLRCSATADEHGLITVNALADFVNDRVLTWLKAHRDSRATQGIQVTIDRGSGGMALAVCRATANNAVPNELVRNLKDAVAALFAYMQTTASSEAASVRAAENSFEVFNTAGIRIWNGLVKGTVAHAEVADLDGDGHAEIIVGVGGSGDDAGKILVYGSHSEMRWSADTTATFNYDSGRSGKLAVRAFATGDLFLNGRREVVALSVDSQGWYPSRLCIFDSGGSLVASYWHPGHLHHVAIAMETAHDTPRIIVSGVNNDLRALLHLDGYINTVFVLDPHDVAGEAPPYFGRLRTGSQLWYGFILPANDTVERIEIVDRDHKGRNEISIWMASHNVFYIGFGGELRSLGSADGAMPGAEFHLLR
ncbi:MAG TPA: caspase family protein [Thermoanaerobaculia bacterium]|nr:caspase family protein [Thermoanaerobaculia bacterium]